jgi:hypothetical protein
MACDFTAYRIAGEDKVVLIHALGTGDVGFGATQGASKVHLTGPGVDTDLAVTTGGWSPTSIVATLPANLGTGSYTVSVSIPTPFCQSSGTLGVVGPGVVSDLLFAAASPAVADLGTIVEVINTKPGFTWNQTKHSPVDLLNMGDVVAPKPTNVTGWGTPRLHLQLPGPNDYKLNDVVETHTLRFNGEAQRVAIQLKSLPPVDVIPLTVPVPSPVAAGGIVHLINVAPGFAWDQTKHGVPHLIRADGTEATRPTVTSGWGTQDLLVDLPDDFPASGVVAAFLKFDSSPAKIPISIERLPKPHTLHVGNLHCTKTEDWTGPDECRLEVKIDNLPFAPLPVQSLNDNRDFDYNVDFAFFDHAAVQLFDEDVGTFVDPDDFLGSATLETGDYARDVTFDRDDAKYTLSVKVKPLV